MQLEVRYIQHILSAYAALLAAAYTLSGRSSVGPLLLWVWMLVSREANSEWRSAAVQVVSAGIVTLGIATEKGPPSTYSNPND